MPGSADDPPVAIRPLLASAPVLLRTVVGALGPRCRDDTDGPGRWTVHEVVAHLAQMEEHGWMHRLRHIADGRQEPLPRVDAHRHLAAYATREIGALLDRFQRQRQRNLDDLDALDVTALSLRRTAVHPDRGPVSLGDLLATWAMHDLDHIAQIIGIIGHHHAQAVGPLTAYLRICQPRP